MDHSVSKLDQAGEAWAGAVQRAIVEHRDKKRDGTTADLHELEARGLAMVRDLRQLNADVIEALDFGREWFDELTQASIEGRITD